ncbi:hypothetical protein P5V15_011097 [Pogonomyrmex californicus]
MGSNNSLAKIIFHLSLVNALTRGIKCIQRLGGGDLVVEIGSPASVGTVAGGLAEPPRGTPRLYIKTLMISDCSLFTMIPGFCTPVVQTRASPPAPAPYSTADFIWAAYHRAVRPATAGGVSSNVSKSATSLIKTPRSQQMSERYRSSATVTATAR